MTDRRPIAGYEGLYEIDRQGRVFSLPREVRRVDGHINRVPSNLVAREINSRGYYRVTLWKGCKRKRFLLHRLVAQTFIPNPHDLPEVNHMDENKLNPEADNLEWCTRYDNVHYSIERRRAEEQTSSIPEGLPMLSWA